MPATAPIEPVRVSGRWIRYVNRGCLDTREICSLGRHPIRDGKMSFVEDDERLSCQFCVLTKGMTRTGGGS